MSAARSLVFRAVGARLWIGRPMTEGGGEWEMASDGMEVLVQPGAGEVVFTEQALPDGARHVGLSLRLLAEGRSRGEHRNFATYSSRAVVLPGGDPAMQYQLSPEQAREVIVTLWELLPLKERPCPR